MAAVSATLLMIYAITGNASASSDGTCVPLVHPHKGPSSSASVSDSRTKLMVLSSPKAGATLSMRLMLARFNLTAPAYRYGRYPLSYTHTVFDKQPGRAPPTTVEDLSLCAPGGGWLCIHLVRSPLDRAISSYIHTLTHADAISLHFTELRGACGRDVPANECQRNASFAEFARALGARARTRSRSSGDSHFMPQALGPIADDRSSQGLPGVLRVPIEMMSEADGADCAPLVALQPWGLLNTEAAVFGADKKLSHYKVHAQATPDGSEDWPFARVAAAAKAKATPTYDSFWGNKSFCRNVVGCLYAADVALYVASCTDAASPLRQCAAYRRVCACELARLHSVCGIATVPVPSASTPLNVSSASSPGLIVRRSMGERPALRRAQSRTLVQSERE